MASYYRRFIKSFAQTVNAMTALLTTKGEWKWTAEAEIAFEQVKNALSTAPILAQPDFTRALDGSRPFVITTDASIKGIGGVLSQGTDEEEKPLAFHSRGLKSSEKNYSIVDLEALAFTECTRKWRHLIYGLRIVVKTDHLPLVTMFKRKNVSGRIMRWANELSSLNIEFRHVKGNENVVADALSRNPIEGEKDDDDVGDDLILNRISTRSKTVEDRREAERIERDERDRKRREDILIEWKNHQDEDQWVREMIECMGQGSGVEGEEYIIPNSSTLSSSLFPLCAFLMK
ncbi:hypothetical protein PRIPAC_80181 [Pristionchus pacificus]|nr:hypothetical protein PRIPAC_80181 [Pristionchus pacificus]